METFNALELDSHIYVRTTGTTVTGFWAFVVFSIRRVSYRAGGWEGGDTLGDLPIPEIRKL